MAGWVKPRVKQPEKLDWKKLEFLPDIQLLVKVNKQPEDNCSHFLTNDFMKEFDQINNLIIRGIHTNNVHQQKSEVPLAF